MNEVVAAEANTVMHIFRHVPHQVQQVQQLHAAAGDRAAGTTPIRSLRQVAQALVTCPTPYAPALVKTQTASFGGVALWGLDRVDQPFLPLSGTYRYTSTASTKVSVYVLDTGVLVRGVLLLMQAALPSLRSSIAY